MQSITRDELDSIINGWSLTNDNETDWNFEVIDQFFVKHDTTTYIFIFQNPKDNKYYKGKYSQSYNYGIEDDYIDLVEVKPVEVVTIDWQEVEK